MRWSGGFTLVELLSVLMIILCLLMLSSAAITYAQRTARETTSWADLERIALALEEFRVLEDGYPVLSPAAPLKELPQLGKLTNLVSGLRLKDPWGRDYIYSHHAAEDKRYVYQLHSYGADRQDPHDNLLLP